MMKSGLLVGTRIGGNSGTSTKRRLFSARNLQLYAAHQRLLHVAHELMN